MSAVRLEDTPGVTAVATLPCGVRYPVAECARCGKSESIRGRGLCGACKRRCTLDGTIGQYGYTRADRLADYAALRPGMTVEQAAEQVGVSKRTAERYEATLRRTP